MTTESSMITMQEAAAALDGNEYGFEGSRELFARMKAAGLVAVFGASDDLMEFRGAVYDEIGAYDGGTAYFTENGRLSEETSNFDALKMKSMPVKAIWCPEGLDVSWMMTTNLPHARFKIMEGGDLYCSGLVFDLKDCAP